jgi:hypothetical protein
MAKPRIGLFSPPHDAQTERLYRQLEEVAPGAARQFSLGPRQGSPRVALGEAGIYWDDVNVAELTCAYIHGFNYANPVLPSPLDDVDWTLWQADYLIKQQTTSLVHGAFLEMQRRRVTLFNPPDAYVENFMKLNLLEEIRRNGFKVPHMACTNEVETAKQLSTRISPLLWRPCTGRAAWQLFGDRQSALLLAPDKPPILLAEAVQGPLIRAYLFQGKPLFCLQYRVPAPVPMERLEVFQSIQCPEVYGELQRLTEALSLPWALVSLVLKDGEPWIYDIDPDPIFEGLPELYQQRLTEGLAKGLLGEDTNALEPLTNVPQARPTLFLRRMLRILFDIEVLRQQSKP